VGELCDSVMQFVQVYCALEFYEQPSRLCMLEILWQVKPCGKYVPPQSKVLLTDMRVPWVVLLACSESPADLSLTTCLRQRISRQYSPQLSEAQGCCSLTCVFPVCCLHACSESPTDLSLAAWLRRLVDTMALLCLHGRC
jgi:hypothetical protein